MKGTETYLNKGVGIASGNEKDDISCIDIMIGQMKSSTYSTVDKLISGSGTQLVDRVNQGGVGYVPHSGHGSRTTLNSISFSTSSCTQLKNTTAWPFMFCLACDVGIFTKGTCLAEAMVRASSNGLPTGFVATQMASISQPWYEPYAAVKEQNAILTDQYQANSKWTFGGIAMNGCAKMLDQFPKTGPNVSDTWIIFGDPSLLVFTANPTAMNVSHANSIQSTASSFNVSCDMKGALISLTAGGEIIGTAYSNGGSTNILISPALPAGLSTIQVTITAKNKVPYFGNVTVTGTVSVNEQNKNEEISMYPNPVSKLLHISFGTTNEKDVTIAVFDISGKRVLSLNPAVKAAIDIDLSSLSNGVYYLNIKTAGTNRTDKITVIK
jgi:gingipain R